VGTKVVLKGRLREVQGLKNPGAFQQARHWAAEGIFRQVSVRQEGDFLALKGEEAYPLGERLRGGIRRLLKDRDEVTRSLYLAMLLGDQGEITPARRQAFSRTGTSHLLVINGLHLSMVAAAVYFLASWLLRRSAWLLLRVNIFRICTLLAAGAVAAYAWVAGGSPSTQRAEVMVLSYLLLVFLGRAREVWSALALAALVILTLSPLRLFAISFQLSFVAVTALILLVPQWAGEGLESEGPLSRYPDWLPRIIFRLKEWLFASAAASLATAPLVAFYFQVVSLLGWLVNVAAIPLVLGLALPLGEAAVLAQALHLSPVAEFFLTLGSFPLRWGYWAIEQTARLPGSALSVPTPAWYQVLLGYALICAIFLARKPMLRWGGALAAVAVLAGTVMIPRLSAPAHLEITCLDSRTGLDGVAVTPAGQRLVFSSAWEGWTGSSAGGGLGALPSYLHWRQFREVDLVLALGLNRRNAGELLTLARQFKVKGVWFRDLGDQGQVVLDLRNTLGDLGTPALSLERARPPTELGELSLAYPVLGEGRALGLLLAYEGRRVLIVPPRRLGEGEAVKLPNGPPPDVLVAPADWPNALVARLKPKALVTYGSGRRGRPKSAGEGTERYATGEGAVSVYLTAAGVKVEQWRGW
jgi:competence protein ComEC